MTYFIGDVHAKFDRYVDILRNLAEPSIQVGDMGVGFMSPFGVPLHETPDSLMVAGGHRFIRGNHDNPGACAKHSQWIKDGHVEGNMMFVGGGYSIDKDFRVLNESYWEEEELDYMELNHLVGVFTNRKPEIMVTHDCPETIASHMFNKTKLNIPSRTRQAFDAMWTYHQPKLWVFGHWHQSKEIETMGTRFVCLNELEVRDLDV